MPVAASPTTVSAAASLRVQPFENLSEDPARDYSARGLVEDLLLTELSRFPGLELVRARRAPLGSFALYDLWLRGLDCLKRGTLEADAQAHRFFERALGIDPHYARADSDHRPSISRRGAQR